MPCLSEKGKLKYVCFCRARLKEFVSMISVCIRVYVQYRVSEPLKEKNSNFSKLPFTRDLLCFLSRQVSKVLSPNSLIWKIWRAWDEEQPNVMFAVKRIKGDRRSKEVKTEGSRTEADSRPRKSVKRRNSKIGSKHCVDTLHPRYCPHKYLPAFLVIKMSFTTIL